MYDLTEIYFGLKVKKEKALIYQKSTARAMTVVLKISYIRAGLSCMLCGGCIFVYRL